MVLIVLVQVLRFMQQPQNRRGKQNFSCSALSYTLEKLHLRKATSTFQKQLPSYSNHCTYSTFVGQKAPRASGESLKIPSKLSRDVPQSWWLWVCTKPLTLPKIILSMCPRDKCKIEGHRNNSLREPQVIYLWQRTDTGWSGLLITTLSDLAGSVLLWHRMAPGLFSNMIPAKSKYIQAIFTHCREAGWFNVWFFTDTFILIAGGVANVALLWLFLRDRKSLSASKVGAALPTRSEGFNLTFWNRCF